MNCLFASLLAFTLLVCPALVPGQGSAQRAPALQQFQLDAGESIFEFSIDFAFNRVKGRMSAAEGTILWDQANPANSSVTIVIQAKSLETGSALRDRHLKTSDFFDVERYPTIRFQSTRLQPNGRSWLMDGELTMHGVTKAMTLPLVLYPPRRNVSQQLILIGKAPIRIARKDFGITGGANYNPWFNAARMALMADSVDLTIEAQAWLSDAASQRVPPVVEALERVKTQGISAQLDRFRAQIAGKPDSALMGYIAGADYLVRELLEENPAAALSLASELPRLYKGWRAYAISGHALAVTGDSVGAERQYAEARRLFKRKPADPDGLIDNEWYYLDELARASIERGHVRAAIGVAALSAELFPDMSRGLATYGWALHLAGDDTKAVQQFARALEVNPNETRALELRRRIHP